MSPFNDTIFSFFQVILCMKEVKITSLLSGHQVTVVPLPDPTTNQQTLQHHIFLTSDSWPEHLSPRLSALEQLCLLVPLGSRKSSPIRSLSGRCHPFGGISRAVVMQKSRQLSVLQTGTKVYLIRGCLGPCLPFGERNKGVVVQRSRQQKLLERKARLKHISLCPLKEIPW